MNDEIEYLISHEQRNRFIKNLALDLKGNTLVLFARVEAHGQVLYDQINNNKRDDRKVFFIHGGVDAEERELVREITERENNAIIVASYGTFSTGINIKKLHNVIFASPSKSRIRNLQSIGRVLRKGKDKVKATLYDIADDCTTKSRRNYTLNHFIERIKTYNEENFNYEIITIQFKGMIEDDFYCTVKLKSGEEIFARVINSEEEDRTMLLVSHPIIVNEIKGRMGVVGYKIEPWLKTTTDDMFVVNLEDVLTMSESTDIEMIMMYQDYIRSSESDKTQYKSIKSRS